MTKKGEKGTYHKPKARVAVYGGVAIGALNLGGVEGSRGVDIIFPQGGKRSEKALAVAKDLMDNPVEAGVINGGGPAAAGVILSVAADKLGVNKVLAKMKFPIRV